MWRVVIADDEAYIRNGLPKLIPWQQLDCRVVGFAENGEDLIEKAEKYKPDIVIADINMPRLNGLEAARRLHEKHPGIAWIILTAYADFKYAQAAVDIGAVSYIVKTDVIEELPNALRKAGKQLSRERAGEGRPALAVSFLRALADGSWRMRQNEEGFLSLMEEYEKKLERPNRLAVIELIGERGAQEEKNLLMLLGASLLSFEQETFPMDRDHICQLIDSSNDDLAALIGEYEDLIPIAQGLCGIRLRIAISAVFVGPEQMSAAYSEARRLLTQHMSDADIRILTLDCDTKGASCDCEAPNLEDLRSDLLTMDESAYGSWLDERLLPLRRSSIYEARSFGMSLIARCRRLIHYYDKELRPKKLHEIEVEILASETFGALRETLEVLLRETADMIASENAKINQLIRATDAFIEKHYMRRISLQDVATGVHANASYLSRFYKEKTGENLFDVINGKKVEKACELLRGGEMKTYEVAQAVGFSDTSYFSKFFKKHTGLTPRDYAARYLSKESQREGGDL